MTNYNDINESLNEILDILGISKDREKFIQEFSSNLFKQTVGELMETVSKREQEEIIKRMNDAKDEAGLIVSIETYFTRKEFAKQLLSNYQNALKRLFESILPNMTHEQIVSLKSFKSKIERSVGEAVLNSIQKS